MIELLIVMAIIGVLASIAIPQFMGYQQKASDKAAQSDLYTLNATVAAHMIN